MLKREKKKAAPALVLGPPGLRRCSSQAFFFFRGICRDRGPVGVPLRGRPPFRGRWVGPAGQPGFWPVGFQAASCGGRAAPCRQIAVFSGQVSQVPCYLRQCGRHCHHLLRFQGTVSSSLKNWLQSDSPHRRELPGSPESLNEKRAFYGIQLRKTRNLPRQPYCRAAGFRVY